METWGLLSYLTETHSSCPSQRPRPLSLAGTHILPGISKQLPNWKNLGQLWKWGPVPSARRQPWETPKDVTQAGIPMARTGGCHRLDWHTVGWERAPEGVRTRWASGLLSLQQTQRWKTPLSQQSLQQPGRNLLQLHSLFLQTLGAYCVTGTGAGNTAK
jgi:hypothetical protein